MIETFFFFCIFCSFPFSYTSERNSLVMLIRQRQFLKIRVAFNLRAQTADTHLLHVPK